MSYSDSHWQVLHSHYLFEKPWLTVREEKVLLANGQIIPSYYILEYPDWIAVIALTADDRFVFVRQYRHALGITAYELCAGVCETSDASPLEAARRELLEETGYGEGNWELFMTEAVNPSTHTNRTYCFLATGVEKIAEPHLDATEELSVHLLSRSQVESLLKDDRIAQSLHAAPLWKYLALHPSVHK